MPQWVQITWLTENEAPSVLKSVVKGINVISLLFNGTAFFVALTAGLLLWALAFALVLAAFQILYLYVNARNPHAVRVRIKKEGEALHVDRPDFPEEGRATLALADTRCLVYVPQFPGAEGQVLGPRTIALCDRSSVVRLALDEIRNEQAQQIALEIGKRFKLPAQLKMQLFKDEQDYGAPGDAIFLSGGGFKAITEETPLEKRIARRGNLSGCLLIIGLLLSPLVILVLLKVMQ